MEKFPFLNSNLPEEEEIEKVGDQPKQLRWINITIGKKLCERPGGHVSKATIIDGEDSLPTIVKVYSDADCNELGFGTEELVMHEAKALKELQGLPGVPKLYGVVSQVEPSALLMSYQSGSTLLQELIEDGDTLMALLGFMDLCNVLKKIHDRGWAIYNLQPDNILVHIDSKGDARSTILDYTLSTPVFTNTHHGYYTSLTELPNQLPPEVLEPYCQGDLVDRFLLCLLCKDVSSMMSPSKETKSVRRRARRGLMDPLSRPKPRCLFKAVDRMVATYLATELLGDINHIPRPQDLPSSGTTIYFGKDKRRKLIFQ